MVTLEGRIEDGIAFFPPGTVTPWLVEGPVRAHVSLTRMAIASPSPAVATRRLTG